MASVSDVVKGLKEWANKKANFKTKSSKLNQNTVDKLKKNLDDCTKSINRMIKTMGKKESVITILGELIKNLENSLSGMKEEYIMAWDFYNICWLLEGALEWYVEKNRLFEEVIGYIYTGLTGKDKKSFSKDIEDMKAGGNITLNIKFGDKSMTAEVKKSLNGFLLSLMKVCFYSNVKEFKRKEIKDTNAENKVLSQGATGSVRKIDYIDKHNEKKTRAIKTINDRWFKDWDDKSKGLSEDVMDFIEGPKLVEDTFKKYKQEYKKNKKIIKENEKFGGKKVKDVEKAKDESKNKFRNLAIQKVRKTGNEFVMISKLAKGNLTDFYYVVDFNKEPAHKTQLDNKKKINKLFTDLTSGIEQLHAVGLVHGDIKPLNILVYETKNEGLKYKITDFDGVVRVKNYKDNKVHTSGYVPECYDTIEGIPNGEEAKKVDCYAICLTLKNIFDDIRNFRKKDAEKLQNYARNLVSKYEKDKSCEFKVKN